MNIFSTITEGDSMSDSPFYFIASTYFGTGEGITCAYLITYAYPDTERDYKIKPKVDLDSGKFYPGELKYPREEVALLEFRDLFGDFISVDAEVLTQDEFFNHHPDVVPQRIRDVITGPKTNWPGNFKWHSSIHMNYS